MHAQRPRINQNLGLARERAGLTSGRNPLSFPEVAGTAAPAPEAATGIGEDGIVMSAVSRVRALTRAVVVGGGAAAGLVLLAVPAFAHITVTPGSAQAGSAAVLTFHVPNEEAKADAIRVDMQIPTAHPIAQLLVQPVPGWQVSVKTVTLAKPVVTDDGQFTQAVSEVIWSGGQIAPGQFQDFSISADPLPQAVGSIAFKAIQTYSNGDVVRWIDVARPGQPEPDHPAPVLTLTAGPAAPAGAAAPAATAAPGPDGTARAIAAGGVLAGLAGLALAALAWRRMKTLAVPGPAAPALNGHGPATAPARPAREQPNGADQPAPAQPGRQAPSGRGAAGRKGPDGRRRPAGR